MATEENIKQEKLTDSSKLLLLGAVAFSGWLLYLLGPVLTPFFISAILAYLADPLVDKLESKGLSRISAVALVFVLLTLILLMTSLVLLPMLGHQLSALIQRMPDYLLLIQTTLTGWMSKLGLPDDLLAVSNLRQAATDYWAEVGQVMGGVMGYVTHSGMAALQLLANLVLIPVITFYLLCDWDNLVLQFRALLPRRYAAKVIGLSLECDQMLSAFMRGQILVMLALAIIYSLGLTLIGLELGLLLGILAGLLSFVPYLGLIVGIGLAGVAAFFQFHAWLPVVEVAAIFTIAQVIEGSLLTPKLVGDRIGLHPVVVIFSVLAGGQLFGFVGMLLALPVAAVAMVLLRHTHREYISSDLYR